MAIISNTSEAHIEFLESNYSFFECFRERVYSHIIRLRKPNLGIYEYARDLMGVVVASDCLFIDDRIENIRAAEDLGWRTIHFDGVVPLRRALREVGVDIH